MSPETPGLNGDMRLARVCFIGIFVLNRVSNLSFFVLIRVSVYRFLSSTGYLFLDDEQQYFYKLLLINIDFC